MRPIQFCIFLALPALLTCQSPALSSEQRADSDALRVLAKSVPLLPFERIELNVVPSLTLFGYSAAAGDKKGNIYVIHRPLDANIDPVVVLDSKGNLLRSWGKGMYTMPHSIRIDPAGNVWTVDARTSKIFKFTAEGKKLLEISIGDIPDTAIPFCGATDITFAPNGHIYVSDGYCNARFLEYSAEGKKLGEWGTLATLPLKAFRTRSNVTKPGEFNLAHDISLGPDGILYIADRENGRLQWFDKTGKYLGAKKFGGQLFSVTHGPSGELYIGAHAPDAATLDQDSFIFRFDPLSGKVVGRIDAPAHQLSVAPDGTLLPGTRWLDTQSILLFRPVK